MDDCRLTISFVCKWLFTAVRCEGLICVIVVCLGSTGVPQLGVWFWLCTDAWGTVRRSWRHIGSAVWRLPVGPSHQNLQENGSLDFTGQWHNADTQSILQQHIFRWAKVTGVPVVQHTYSVQHRTFIYSFRLCGCNIHKICKCKLTVNSTGLKTRISSPCDG
jgi:hypothetical protein